MNFFRPLDEIAEALAEDFTYEQFCDESFIYQEVTQMIGMEGEEVITLIKEALRMKLLRDTSVLDGSHTIH